MEHCVWIKNLSITQKFIHSHRLQSSLFGCNNDRKHKMMGIVKYNLDLTHRQILFHFLRLNSVKVVG